MKKNIGDYHRAISAIFSVPIFKHVFTGGYNEYVIDKINQYRNQIGIRKETSIRAILKKTYSHLTLNYRSEYFYKNHIANELLLELHKLDEASLFNEVRIAGSIADIVIVNGTNTIYEIKTELDSPDKLKKQIEDYRKVSPKIFLVTHHSLVEKYSDLIDGSSVGLISLSEKNKFNLVKDAYLNFENLSNKVMMDTLRKEEYSNIIMASFGCVPKVSNIRFYKECQQIVEQLDTTTFHNLMMEQLRNRMLYEKELIASKDTPVELKHICLSFNPNKTEFQNLYSFLNLTI